MDIETMLTNVGEFLARIGHSLMPISFVAYILVRWLGHFWGRSVRISVCNKAIWYTTAGFLTLGGDVYVQTVVGYLCLVEAWDHFLTYRKDVLAVRLKNKGSNIG